jgi:alkylation response protein AidB-like acyl-CoA dehydrogenase
VQLSGTFNGLGLRSNDSAPVRLEGVSVAPDELLTEQGKGIDYALQVAIPWFNVGTSAMTL